jgi:predicted AlkP superfamily pyrophosphatase or phosphodiesterase
MRLSLRKQLVAQVLIACLLCCLPSPAQQSASPLRLVLVVVIDQFSFDYLPRYSDRFGSAGFRYLMEHGADFVGCRYKQATTKTAVGHSVISTGGYPWSTGVVANQWFDRRKNEQISAVADDSAQLVGGNGAGASSRMMLGTTIGDEMKLASNGRSKIFALSLKDRASLMLSGRLANGAFWLDDRTANFVSSSQFGSMLPAWVKSFNDQHYADRYFGKAWQRLLPENLYTASTRDDYPYETALPGDGKQFPHVITGGASAPNQQYYQTFMTTPAANQMLCDLAREAIDKEGLGQHSDPDMLGVSFSAMDMIGHAFGPYSQESEDAMLRLDQNIANLLQYVDQKVGLNKCLVVLTGDHGVCPVPEFLKERGLDAGRIDPKTFKTLLDSALDSRLGQDDWIADFDPPNLYLNLAAIDRQKYRQPEVEALAAKLAHSIPGIAEAYTAAQFFQNQLPVGAQVEAVKRSYYWGRSGELYVVPKPGYVFSEFPTGTGHGTPYAYDQHVPLILYGYTIQAGKYAGEVSPADIAPTIAAVLGIGLPSNCEGRALTECLSQVLGPARPAALNAPVARTNPE